MTRVLIVALVSALALGMALAVAAQSRTNKNVEIRVWESTSDARVNFISARPEGGSWRTLGTIPIPLDEETDNGRFRYGDITLAVPVDVPEPEAPGFPAFVEVTCTYTLETTQYLGSWWKFQGEITQHLPFAIEPQLNIELYRASGVRVDQLTASMVELAPGVKAVWDHGGAFFTDAEELEFDRAAIVSIDDGYFSDRRIELEPPIVCTGE